MKQTTAHILCFIHTISIFTVTSAPVLTMLMGTCEDSGVMLAGAEIDCKYLENPSAYNIHKNPERFCMKYQKECCVTCTRLKQNGYYTTKSTAASHTSTKASIQISEQPTEMCNDTGVWIDGLVECRYLERPSAYNIHKNPAGFCHKYFNKCCATCTRLKQNGYSTIGSASIVPTAASHTLPKASILLTVRPTESCKDTGAWEGDGLVECRYLEQPSSYNIHKNPDGFCQKNFNECCVTCSRLKQNGLITLNYVTEKTTESTSTIEKPKSLKTTAYEHLKLPNFVLTIINFAYKVISG
ncbi:uncharacterized protein LOC143042558 isoform X2 [Mytilus galloprovincialis]|uniref:uncharacterized protein LOC143042558 isoform X2 n=1 Tax=Mytilus galloprovincialis TaxID=29158 RepID=UPI003F7B3E6A